MRATAERALHVKRATCRRGVTPPVAASAQGDPDPGFRRHDPALTALKHNSAPDEALGTGTALRVPDFKVSRGIRACFGNPVKANARPEFEVSRKRGEAHGLLNLGRGGALFGARSDKDRDVNDLEIRP